MRTEHFLYLIKMKYNELKFIVWFAFLFMNKVICQEIKKADTLMVNSKKSLTTKTIEKENQTKQSQDGETRSSGVIKTNPEVLYKDEEKVNVKPN